MIGLTNQQTNQPTNQATNYIKQYELEVEKQKMHAAGEWYGKHSFSCGRRVLAVRGAGAGQGGRAEEQGKEEKKRGNRQLFRFAREGEPNPTTLTHDPNRHWLKI